MTIHFIIYGALILLWGFSMFCIGYQKGIKVNKVRHFYFDKYGGFYSSEEDCLKHHHVFFEIKATSLSEALVAYDRYIKQ